MSEQVQIAEKVMILCKERDNSLSVLFEDLEPNETGAKIIPSHEFQIMNLRSRFNPGVFFYKVKCEDMIRYGMTADDIWDMIKQRYDENPEIDLTEEFTFIERI